jgi:hypothetical protein
LSHPYPLQQILSPPVLPIKLPILSFYFLNRVLATVACLLHHHWRQVHLSTSVQTLTISFAYVHLRTIRTASHGPDWTRIHMIQYNLTLIVTHSLCAVAWRVLSVCERFYWWWLRSSGSSYNWVCIFSHFIHSPKVNSKHAHI